MSENDWENAPEWANWRAQCELGAWFWSEEKPYMVSAFDGRFLWCHGNGRCESYKQDAPNPNWANSLDERPQKEAVNHPAHYNAVPGIECFDVIRHFNYNLGNAIKHIWNAGKNGHAIEDFRWAIFYLEDEISRINKGDKE